MKKLEFELEIYTFQIDFANHVSNIVYIQWMEVGRSKLLEAIGLPIDQLTRQGIAPILASTEIAYKEPLYLGDRVRVETWISELRRASARLAYRFYRMATSWQPPVRRRDCSSISTQSGPTG